MTDRIRQCPLCASSEVAAISDHLFHCKRCRIAVNTAYSQKSYSDTYFLDEYKNQYGKTYIEDRHNITALSQKRLATIFNYLPGKNRNPEVSLLDIGAAAGFFLDCARTMGINHCTGIEISEYASNYCEKHFNIPIMRSSFSNVTLSRSYTIITAWFFIEHCREPLSVIKKIYDALEPGGIFACSVPSIFGPLFLFNREEWIRTHPSDHFMDFSPHAARRYCSRIGFSKIHIKPAGIHPERLVDAGSLFHKPFAVAYRLVSTITAFSDTIEIYAVK